MNALKALSVLKRRLAAVINLQYDGCYVSVEEVNDQIDTLRDECKASLTWQLGLPTEPGMYFASEGPQHRASVVRVCWGDGGLHMYDGNDRILYWDDAELCPYTCFMGPIPWPDGPPAEMPTRPRTDLWTRSNDNDDA